MRGAGCQATPLPQQRITLDNDPGSGDNCGGDWDRFGWADNGPGHLEIGR